MIQKLYSWYGKRNVRIVALILLALVVVVIFINKGDGTEAEPTVKQATLVNTSTVADFSDSSSLQLVGTVRAVSEATIQTEAAGRVTAVNVEIGEEVRAGQVIATLENANEYASLLQAEGSYEAAQAAAAASNISVEEAENAVVSAKNGAISAYRGAYSSVNDTVLNLVDKFYTGENTRTPGVTLSDVDSTTLAAQRRDLETALKQWKVSTDNMTVDSDFAMANTEAVNNTTLVIAIIDELIKGTTDNDNKDRSIEGALAPTYTSALTAARSATANTLSSLRSAETSVENAEDTLEKAKIGGTNSELSSANAQVKQALGSLRAAQANYEKTILRTSIGGTVNELAVKTGDFVGNSFKAAVVANNGSLEITTFVGESDRDRLQIGQTVMIENKYEGVVTNIAPAVNQATKKVEVKIQTDTDEVANGETVKISITNSAETPETNTILSVPLTAVKFTAQDGYVFTVEDNKLVANPVVIGAISGSFVIIESGIDSSTEFVVDARGLASGQEVEVNTK